MPSSPREVMLATLLRVFAGKVQILRSPVELLVMLIKVLIKYVPVFTNFLITLLIRV